MRKNIINFETHEPLFSLENAKSLIFVASHIMMEVAKTKNYNTDEWTEFAKRWCKTQNMPADIETYLCDTIASAINFLNATKLWAK